MAPGHMKMDATPTDDGTTISGAALPPALESSPEDTPEARESAGGES